MEVGCSWGGTRLVTRDLHLLNLELCEECSRIGWNLPEQLAGNRSRSGCNRGAAFEADAIGEQQLKRMQLRAAAEAGTGLLTQVNE